MNKITRYFTLLLFTLAFHFGAGAQTDTIYMCSGTANQVSNAPNGVLYDSGGPTGGYTDNQYCSLVIDPGCATSITINLETINSEGCCDYLIFYDGDTEQAPNLGSWGGSASNITVTAQSGKVFIRWRTDGSVTSSGFVVRWTSVLTPPIAPQSTVGVSDVTPALHEVVAFTGSATNFPITWNWNFGDGSTSTQQSPQHSYSTPGIYTVRLITGNCHGLKDTIITAISVQQPPVLQLSPANVAITTSCGTPGQTTLQVTNTGQGDLLFDMEGALGGQQKVVLYTQYAFVYSLQSINNILGFYGDDLEISTTAALDSASMALALKEQDVLIFPELPPSFDIWQLMSMRGALNDFVADGGSIIICGANYYNSVISAFDFLGATSANSLDVSNQTISLTQGHPITAGISNNLLLPYFSGTHIFAHPDYVSLANINGGSLLGYREFDKGNVVYMGFNFQNYNQQLGTLLINAVNWCGKRDGVDFFPQQGTVAPGDTLLVTVSVPTEGLYAGEYSGVITVNTNEQGLNSIELPLTLTVTGTAILTLTPDSIGFGSFQQFDQRSSIVLLENTGCDTLFITGITPTQADITVNADNITILPYSSDTIQVIFNPQDTGYFAENIIFSTNAGDVALPITTYSIGAPQAVISPDSLEVSLSCTDSVAYTFVISNTGLGDLVIQGGSNSEGVQIAILDLFSYSGQVGYNIEDWLNDIYPDGQFAHINYWSTQTEVENLLSSSDMVIIPAFNSFDYINFGAGPIRQMLTDYANNGGTILFTGTPYLYNTGMPDVLTGPNTYSSLFLPQLPQPLIANHPLLNEVELSGNTYDNIWGVVVANSDYQSIIESNGYDILGYRPAGGGKVIYIGHKCEYPQEVQPRRLVENAVKWSLTPEWLDFDINTLTIAPGASDSITVTLNTAGLEAGTYEGAVHLNVNQPLTPVLTLPITLHVNGAPAIVVPTTAYNFGVIQQFSEKTISIPFENTGCDSLHLTALNFSNPDFSVANAPMVVAPFTQRNIAVQFSSTTVGFQSGTLTILSDGGDQVVQLSGLVVGAPVSAITPSEIKDTLNCSQMAIHALAMSNSGLGGFNYQIGVPTLPRSVTVLKIGTNPNRYASLLSQLAQYNNGGIIRQITDMNAQRFGDSLAQSEILVIPPIETTNISYSAFKPQIDAFIGQGGVVLIAGLQQKDALVQMGLITAATTIADYYYPVIEKTNPGHGLAASTPNTPFTMEYYQTCMTFPSNAGFVRVMKVQGQGGDYLSYKLNGKGLIIWWGNLFEYQTNNSSLIWTDIMDWSANPLPNGASIQGSTTGIVPASGTQTVNVLLSGDGLSAGKYTGQIRVYSNDPVNNPWVIPVTLTMTPQPCANFSFESDNCSGSVAFNDSSTNQVTSFYWQFGDGSESFQTNPVHTYLNSGNYTVTLVGCNNFGCDTTQQQVVVNQINGPITTSCAPVTVNYCCEIGISSVSLGQISHITGSAQSDQGYQDFSCTQGTELMAGAQYPITITTGNSNNEFVRVWIDFNNNGTFTANEQVFNNYGFITHNGFITIPVTAVKDIPLRMRVISDNYDITSPCNNLNYGQAEDYYVISRTVVKTDDAQLAFGASIAPNPSNGSSILKFKGNEETTTRLRIVRQTGETVYEQLLEGDSQVEQQVTLPAQADGVYFVQLQSGDQVFTGKWVVVR